MAIANSGHVLVIDDNIDFQEITASLAERAHCRMTRASTLREARRLTRAAQYDLILVDLDLPDGNGLDLLDDIDLAAHGPIAIVTGYPSVESAARAVRSPAVEYLLKPIAADTLTSLLDRARQRAQTRWPSKAREFGGMVGQDPAMKDLFDRIRRVAPLDVCVLIHGESGTGKELVARAVHDLSGREGRFVAVNCGAIASELLSSQLFGHERGAFTGALQSHAGFFEQAAGGTLFLDEITEMSPTLQVYLLRALETRSLMRVGGTREVSVDVRVVAATNRDPQKAVASGTLREDLYYRLSEFPLPVPALRERREDIPLLAQHFLERLNERYGTQRRFSAEALHQLGLRPWPGNVRELRHAVQRQYILTSEEEVGALPEQPVRLTDEGDGVVRFRVGMTFDDVEREMLLKTLTHFGNNKRQAARVLGITAKTIYNRLLRYRSLGLINDDLLGSPDDEDATDDPA